MQITAHEVCFACKLKHLLSVTLFHTALSVNDRIGIVNRFIVLGPAERLRSRSVVDVYPFLDVTVVVLIQLIAAYNKSVRTHIRKTAVDKLKLISRRHQCAVFRRCFGDNFSYGTYIEETVTCGKHQYTCRQKHCRKFFYRIFHI